jgi:hypothetical protein
MVWAKLDDAYGDDCAHLSDAAFRTHTEGLGWTMRRVTEGRITMRDLRRFAETAEPEDAVAELVKTGWWDEHDSGDGWQIVHDMDYQRTREQIEADRAATAERQRRWREAHGKKKPRSKPGDEPLREDVERLCAHLADRMEAKGSKRPSVTKTWRDETRLMLTSDGRTEEQVKRAIDWCQDSPFWHSKVMSMPKLREKYDQLRLEAAEQERKQRSGSNGHGGMQGGARQEVLPPDEVANLDPETIA